MGCGLTTKALLFHDELDDRDEQYTDSRLASFRPEVRCQSGTAVADAELSRYSLCKQVGWGLLLFPIIALSRSVEIAGSMFECLDTDLFAD